MFIRERASSETEDPEVRAFARYALNELNTAGSSVVGRRCPPSQHEVDVSKMSQSVFFSLFLVANFCLILFVRKPLE